MSTVNKKDAEIEEVCNFLLVIRKRMENLDTMRKDTSKYLHYLGLVESDYAESFERYDELKREFGLFDKLWFGRSEWKLFMSTWLKSQFQSIDIE